MKIIYFGTGNATVTKCYNTCFAIYENDKYFLVDGGGGNQILSKCQKHKIDLGNVHDIFVTHEHLDHILGIFWLIRIIGQKYIDAGKYEGNLDIYCHEELAKKIISICKMTINNKVLKYFDKRIIFHNVEDGEKLDIIGCPVTFFDICSTKAKQFGFTMITSNNKKITCLGDEPYRECEEKYIKDSYLLMHEAFCLYSQADKFHPYEKSHSTVKEACELAQKFNIPNLVLYHTEEVNIDNRKKMYTDEGKEFYKGNLIIPDDDEEIEI